MKKGVLHTVSGVLFFFWSHPASAQLSVKDAALLAEAREFYAMHDYEMVWNTLDGLSKIYVDSPEVAYLMGASGMQLNARHLESYAFLKRAATLGYEPAYYLYAKALLEQMELGEAGKYAQLAMQGDTAHRLEINKLENQVNNAVKALTRPAGVVLESLGDKVNSGFVEHTPIVSADDSILYFTSRRPINAAAVRDYNNQYDENIYMSRKEKNGWTMAAPLKGDVNDLLNDATVGLSADGRQMIVFKTSRDTESSDLWLARKDEGVWKLDGKLKDPINSRWVESSAAVNSNGNVYIVASDRPGGYGGMDLYRVVVFANGDLSEPQNLGPVINSEFDETSPFLLPDDRTLFFSSDNRKSIGGYDVFRSTMVNDTTWTTPENLGYPLNSTRDDLHLTVSWKGGRAYFTRSNPNKPGDFDIYQANLPGFNMKANVWKVRLLGIGPEEYDNLDISLYSSDAEQKLGTYLPDIRGLFLFALLPGESGVLRITCEGYKNIELPFAYSEYGSIKEFPVDIEMQNAKP